MFYFVELIKILAIQILFILYKSAPKKETFNEPSPKVVDIKLYVKDVTPKCIGIYKLFHLFSSVLQKHTNTVMSAIKWVFQINQNWDRITCSLCSHT